jgi:hypothetical protein
MGKGPCTAVVYTRQVPVCRFIVGGSSQECIGPGNEHTRAGKAQCIDCHPWGPVHLQFEAEARARQKELEATAEEARTQVSDSRVGWSAAMHLLVTMSVRLTTPALRCSPTQTQVTPLLLIQLHLTGC